MNEQKMWKVYRLTRMWLRCNKDPGHSRGLMNYYNKQRELKGIPSIYE